jgi:hypothetical protein
MSQKNVATIHDISGFGRCSLTVALPLLSVSGVQTSVIPTAVLSTHTGGFKSNTFHDLTADIEPISEHWKREGIKFDAVLSTTDNLLWLRNTSKHNWQVTTTKGEQRPLAPKALMPAKSGIHIQFAPSLTAEIK